MTDEIIGYISEIEKRTFSDAWSEQLLRETLEKPYNFFLVCTGEQFEKKICRLDTKAALENSKINGYLIASLIADESELLRIAVCNDKRGKGTGSELVRTYFEELENKAVRSLLEVRAGNRAARGLYEKYGYRELGTRKNYYHNPTEDAVIYERCFDTK